MTPHQIEQASSLLSSIKKNQQSREAIKGFIVFSLRIGRDKNDAMPIELDRLHSGTGSVTSITINDGISMEIMSALDEYYSGIIANAKTELRTLGVDVD